MDELEDVSIVDLPGARLVAARRVCELDMGDLVEVRLDRRREIAAGTAISPSIATWREITMSS